MSNQDRLTSSVGESSKSSQQNKEIGKSVAGHAANTTQCRGGIPAKGLHFTKKPWSTYLSVTDRHLKPPSYHNNYTIMSANRNTKLDINERRLFSHRVSSLASSSKTSRSSTGSETITRNTTEQPPIDPKNKSQSSPITKKTLHELSHLAAAPSENHINYTRLICSTPPSQPNHPTEPGLILPPRFASTSTGSIQDKSLSSPSKDSTSKSPTNEISESSSQSDASTNQEPAEETSISHNGQNSLYLVPFKRGSIIQLGDGELKCVEQISTTDLVKSAEMSGDFKSETCTISKISKKNEDNVVLELFVDSSKTPVQLESSLEHPYFVTNHGWASCNPEKTKDLYHLDCKALLVGDVCIFLSSSEKTTSQETQLHDSNKTTNLNNLQIKREHLGISKSGTQLNNVDGSKRKRTLNRMGCECRSDGHSRRVKRQRRWSTSDIIVSEHKNYQPLPSLEPLDILKTSF